MSVAVPLFDGLCRGHCASRAEAATSSTPTYAKIAMDRDILRTPSVVLEKLISFIAYNRATPQVLATPELNSVGECQSVDFSAQTR